MSETDEKVVSGQVRPFRCTELGEGDEHPDAEPGVPRNPVSPSQSETRRRPGVPSGGMTPVRPDGHTVRGASRPFEPAEFEGLPGDAISSPTGPNSGEGPNGSGEGPETAVDEARRKAEEILSGAEKEAERIRSEAHRAGLAAGQVEGRAALEAAAARLENVAKELAAHKPSLYDEARRQVVELALSVVKKILGPLAEADAQAVLRVVEKALQQLSDREILTIRVHPDDLKSLVEAKPKILEAFDGIQKLTVLDDPSVKRGGCLVQTPTTEIDARLETQLQEIVRAVRSA